MSVKQHYDTHLGHFYSWMVGDFAEKQQEQQQFFEKKGLLPVGNKVAIDLGAGHGLQTVSLSQLGFSVVAVDFNAQLLAELQQNAADFHVEILKEDIRYVSRLAALQPELIICWGDTLTHLENLHEIEKFILDCCRALGPKGKLALSFRDYSVLPSGQRVVIPVKSEGGRMLECVLEYGDTHVMVTDMLRQKQGDEWSQSQSSYYKTRVSPAWVVDLLEHNGFSLVLHETVAGMTALIAQKE